MADPVAKSSPQQTGGSDDRLEECLFPSLTGWKRALGLYLYYLLVIILLLLLYGRGDFTTAPFVYQGF